VAVKSSKKPPQPVRHRVCSACGWTTYPKPQENGSPWVVTWVVPTACERGGNDLGETLP
jgi:hypothetical protein